MNAVGSIGSALALLATSATVDVAEGVWLIAVGQPGMLWGHVECAATTTGVPVTYVRVAALPDESIVC